MHVVVVAGAARRGSKKQRGGAELYCLVVVEGVSSGVNGEYVVRWCCELVGRRVFMHIELS